MIFRIFPPAATFHGVGYNDAKQQKGTGRLLCHSGFGYLEFGQGNIGADKFRGYLERQTSLNSRIRKPQFHAVLSCNGRVFSHEQLSGLALKIMDRLGYGGNPILVYAHSDTGNNHVHVVTTRIDGKGGKISDRFEKKRANAILAELMGQSPHMDFEKDLRECAAYRVSSAAQFLLLMEQRGYRTGWEEGCHVFYKYGKKMGVLAQKNIDAMLSLSPVGDEKKRRIQALVFKYKKLYSPALAHGRAGRHATEKADLKSPLTAWLKKSFGLDFIFFTAKGHEKPYGYVLIDHRDKAVYKGSDILPLGVLVQEHMETLRGETKKNGEVWGLYGGSINQPAPDAQETYQPGIGIGYIIDSTIQSAEKANERSGRNRVWGNRKK